MPISQVRRPRRRNSRRGAVAVEFAITLPVVLLLFLGALEMMNLNFIKHTAANAAYEGARSAMVAGGSLQQAGERAEQHLNRAGVGRGAEVDATGTGEQVTVRVRVPVNLNSYGLSYFSSGLDITRVCTLGRETRQSEP